MVKYGGSAMEDPAKVTEILREIAGLAAEGYSLVLVHGGGKEISAELTRRGMKAVFAGGFRVTDISAMAVVEEGLDRKVNPGIVSQLNGLGCKARGISGRQVFHATKAPKADGVDLGRVGEVERCSVETVRKCLETKETAVVSPAGQGNDGGAMNLNADVAAAALAGSTSPRPTIVENRASPAASVQPALRLFVCAPQSHNSTTLVGVALSWIECLDPDSRLSFAQSKPSGPALLWS